MPTKPMPKNIQELMANLSFKEITPEALQYYERAGGKNPNPMAFFDPLRNEIYVGKEALASPELKQKVVLHEFTHKIVPEINNEEFGQIYKDVKRLGIIPDSKLKEILKYSEYNRGKELLARFTEYFPNEVIKPTTATGQILNKAFAKQFNWNNKPKFLLEELKEKLSGISKENLLKSSKDIVKLFTDKLTNYLNNSVRMIYIKTKNTISRQNNEELDYSIQDEKIINDYANSTLLWNSYANINESMTKKLNSILESSFEENVFNPEEAKKRILKEIPQLTKNRLNAIIRTEYANVKRTAMGETYKQLDPEEKNLYVWLSTPDNRRTVYCKNISERTRNGVTMKELKQIIKEEADKNTYTSQREFQPHINCRSSYILTIK